ncbi:hypothetical protein NA57DRAFT_54839 [Rhizodiscina lignyota]|uniref:Uncharacterized protein n=1 Tax=Rhizodiscina lignyota TaxID=1504668 RepID=A0A9P4M7J5_9PEZI|nr:hypothetical protein NA57DRAFT_54839 [Rhizodiscina lignyota]
MAIVVPKAGVVNNAREQWSWRYDAVVGVIVDGMTRFQCLSHQILASNLSVFHCTLTHKTSTANIEFDKLSKAVLHVIKLLRASHKITSPPTPQQPHHGVERRTHDLSNSTEEPGAQLRAELDAEMNKLLELEDRVLQFGIAVIVAREEVHQEMSAHRRQRVLGSGERAQARALERRASEALGEEGRGGGDYSHFVQFSFMFISNFYAAKHSLRYVFRQRHSKTMATGIEKSESSCLNDYSSPLSRRYYARVISALHKDSRLIERSSSTTFHFSEAVAHGVDNVSEVGQ